MRRAAAWDENMGEEHALDRLRKAMGLSGLVARYRVWLAIGSWVGEQGEGTLGVWRPLGVGILYIGSRIGGPGNSEVVLGGAGGGREAGDGRLVGGGGNTLSIARHW